MEERAVKRLHPDEDHFVILHSRESKNLHDDVKSLINKIGLASSKAQGLNHVITSFQSFIGGENTLYLLLNDENTQVLGFIKVGYRNLFLWDRRGSQHEMKILCLLDFFTYPICQRKGHGRRMIDKMLEDQHKEMKQIPIDRPSNLCLSFMNRHFGLCEYMPQSNNYVVFDQFWETSDDAFRSPSRENNVIMPKPLLTPNTKLKPKITAPLSNPYHRSPAPRKQNLNPITWLPYD
ncbi:Alpha-tubulin N-acetyltransferase [Tritrichomonas foetus]|uniref:Alpha-tubulin N-acetyltransferase n=1 Tax=Tritrichomonas foetus TaxID=1144522 RepID=A0A1J4J6W4_9EUKA|nr:Alpha-tubulin N-acetyltransferase [Tritrichomonas foetus]|eukprot:OHS93927.1 Alpha-tubulin N-acetyltransferase [Tritrichomonas foetus]